MPVSMVHARVLVLRRVHIQVRAAHGERGQVPPASKHAPAQGKTPLVHRMRARACASLHTVTHRAHLLLRVCAESMTDEELDTTHVKILQEPSRVARLAKGSGRSALEVLNLIEVRGGPSFWGGRGKWRAHVPHFVCVRTVCVRTVCVRTGGVAECQCAVCGEDRRGS